MDKTKEDLIKEIKEVKRKVEKLEKKVLPTLSKEQLKEVLKEYEIELHYLKEEI